MSTRERARRAAPANPTAEQLLESALEQPGVQEAYCLYAEWEEIRKAARPYYDAIRPRSVVVSSNTSGAWPSA